MLYNVQVNNNISPKQLENLPKERYSLTSSDPHVILVRSANLLDMTLPPQLLAIGRAGIGVNNVPVKACSEAGIVVFNTPGANANAVKELVIAGLFLASRNICQAWNYVNAIDEGAEDLSTQVEAGKKQFVGKELPERTLGIIGLGHIGVEVANAALALGMNVVAYDPQITVEHAWKLSSKVQRARSMQQVMSSADFVTVHVPLMDSTKHMINAKALQALKPGSVVLNFARAGIVDEKAMADALNENHVGCYVSDFPSEQLRQMPQVISLPHLGASTQEAEENCAKMVVNQIRDFIEKGEIVNSVNFPETKLTQRDDVNRLVITNSNVPNMVGQITTSIAKNNLNVLEMVNKSRGDYAYTVVDLDADIPNAVIQDIKKIDGVLSIRKI